MITTSQAHNQRVIRCANWLASGCLAAIVGVACASGCGGSGDTAPKPGLSEQEKQQVKELNEQRASEWGSTKKK